MSNSIFSQSLEEFSKELNVSPAQLINDLNKWSAINARLTQHVEEMKAEHIADMKAGFAKQEEEFVDQLDGEYLRSAEQAGKDRY